MPREPADPYLQHARMIGIVIAGAVGLIAAIAVVTLVPRLSQWHALAQMYRATSPPSGTLFHWQSLQMGYATYRSIVTIGVLEEGLYLKLPPWALFHPPLLIPWGHIQLSVDAKAVWRPSLLQIMVSGPRIKAVVGIPAVASINILNSQVGVDCDGKPKHLVSVFQEVTGQLRDAKYAPEETRGSRVGAVINSLLFFGIVGAAVVGVLAALAAALALPAGLIACRLLKAQFCQ